MEQIVINKIYFLRLGQDQKALNFCGRTKEHR